MDLWLTGASAIYTVSQDKVLQIQRAIDLERAGDPTAASTLFALRKELGGAKFDGVYDTLEDGNLRVIDNAEAATIKGRGTTSDNLSDSELTAAVQKGYANPNHLNELLARADLAPSLLQKARRELSVAITSEKYSSGNIQKVITQLRSAKNADQFSEALAELSRPNRLIESGFVAGDSKVILGAEEGTEYTLGKSKVDPAPVPDADVLYKGADGKTHIEEVKNTASALKQKLDESPEQLARLGEWREADSDNRAIRIVIETERRWTNIFSPGKVGKSPLVQLIEAKVPLSIGSYNLSVEQMKTLNKAVEDKYKLMDERGTFTNWRNFFNQMSTLSDAEEFLGVSLK